MSDDYKQLLKQLKAHDRAIIGIEFCNKRKGGTNLYTFAHESVKIWKVSCSDNDFELMEQKKIANRFCGIQSYDISNDGKLLAVVGIESTLFKVMLDDAYNDIVSDFNVGLMEQWFVKIAPDGKRFFTSSFSGSLKMLDENGQVDNSASFDKVKLISTVAYASSGNQIAVGNSQGWISLVDSNTLLTLFLIEAHACKIRCLEFVLEDEHLLSASDDKIIKLFALAGTKGTLVRNFCGHRGSVMAISVDRGCGGQRFVSAGLDNRLILWDINSGDRLHVFENNSTDFYRTVAFSRDGRFLAAGTDDAVILVYKVPQPEGYIDDCITAEQRNHEGMEDANENIAEIIGLPSELSDSDHEPEDDNNHHIEDVEAAFDGLSATPITPMEGENGTDEANHSNTEATPQDLQAESSFHDPKNYQEEFERRELEMQLGID